MTKGVMQDERYYGGLPHASKVRRPAVTAQALADELEAVALALRGEAGVDQRKVEVTANVAWALKKADARRVRALLDKFADKIAGGPEIIHDIRQWLATNEDTMKAMLDRMEEATLPNRRAPVAEADRGDTLAARRIARGLDAGTVYALLKACGHNVDLWKNDPNLLMDYLVGVLQGDIR